MDRCPFRRVGPSSTFGCRVGHWTSPHYRPGTSRQESDEALARIHNLDLGLFEEAGRPVYDAEAHRRRQLSELDRAAATGHVPTNLLTRWEQRLEDISLWRFAPTAVHGSFTGEHVLVSFRDEDRADAGEVRGVLGWEQSRIGDPADDFADLVGSAAAESLDMVLSAYAQSRVERPDGNLLARARLAAEMTPMRVLLRALASAARDVVDHAAESLRALEERVAVEDELRAVEADRASVEALSTPRVGQRTTPGCRASIVSPRPRTQPSRSRTQKSEPDWDATQPHQPFPDSSVTQAVDAPSPRVPPTDQMSSSADLRGGCQRRRSGAERRTSWLSASSRAGHDQSGMVDSIATRIRSSGTAGRTVTPRLRRRRPRPPGWGRRRGAERRRGVRRELDRPHLGVLPRRLGTGLPVDHGPPAVIAWEDRVDPAPNRDAIDDRLDGQLDLLRDPLGPLALEEVRPHSVQLLVAGGPSSALPGRSNRSTMAAREKCSSTHAWKAVPCRAARAGGSGIGRRSRSAKASGSRARATTADADRCLGTSTTGSSRTPFIASSASRRRRSSTLGSP